MLKTTVDSTLCVSAAPAWHQKFLTVVMAAVQRHARIQFRRLPPCDREEAIAEAVAAAFVSYVRLCARGKDAAAFPSRMAHFAVLRVKSGRRVGTRLRNIDLLAEVPLRQGRFVRHSLPQRETERVSPDDNWREAVLEDRRTCVPDQAAFRIDFPRWLATHTRRNRRIAESLAAGNSTSETARRFRVSPARISQLRQQFFTDWQRFHGEQDADQNMNDPPAETSVEQGGAQCHSA